MHTLYRSLGLEFEDETRKMRKESIQAAINKKEKIALDAMDLNSLRSLDEEDEIPEPAAGTAAPGAGAVPGEAPPGGLPGLDLGSPPGGPPPLPPSGGPPPAPPAGGPPA